MTLHPRHWSNLNGEQAKLVHVNHEGIAFVTQARAVIATMDARLTAAEDPATVLGEWGRTPWGSVQWFEWSSTLEVSWRYQVPGRGAHNASFVATSGAEREVLAAAVAEHSGMTKTERTQSVTEMLKGPAITIAMALVLGGILWWRVGAEVSGGGRTAARAALVTTVANALGYGGIAVLTSIAVVSGAVVLGLRFKNPPRVARLLPSGPIR